MLTPIRYAIVNHALHQGELCNYNIAKTIYLGFAHLYFYLARYNRILVQSSKVVT